MTDQNKLLKNVKMEIRSILLPAQKGLDLTEFLKEYRKIIGRPLPFRELGYQKAEDLLKALPDVVYMQWSLQNNYILKAIADKTTEHIQKLLQKQKSPKLRNKPMPRSSRSGWNSFIPPRLKNITSSQSSAPRLSSLSHHSASAFQPAKSAPYVPAVCSTQSVLTSTPISTINQEICELVKEHVDGINTSDLQQAFRKKYSKYINFEQFNFESFEDYLEQVPGLQPKKFNGVLKIVFVDSQKMSPVPPPPNNNQETTMTDQNKLLKNVKMEIRSILLPAQKGLDLTEFLKEYRKIIGRPLPFRELGYQKAEDLLKALPDVVYMQWSLQNNYILKAIADKTTEHIQKLLQKQKSPKLRNKPMPRSSRSGWNSFIPPRLKNITSSQSSAPRLSSLSHHSASAFQPAKSAPYVPAVCSTQSVLTSTPISTINQEICELVKEHVDGINTSDLQQAFRKKYSKYINFEQFNFESFEDYLEQVPGLQPKKFNGVLKIVFVDSQKMSPVPPPPNNNQETIRPKIHLAYDAMSHIPSRKFHANLHEAPKDAVLPGAKYATEILPSVPKGQYIGVFIGTIINPATLWIQLCGKRTSGALCELMVKMKLLYNSEDSEDYIMRDQDIVAGVVGAGIWTGDRNWYRICIISVDMDSVLAKFVDYGSTGKIPKTMLRYLRKEFIMLPSQAIRARMAYLFPIGEEWDTKARDRLIEIGKNKPIMAEIVDSPEYKDVLSLLLCDTTAEDGVYLNLLLIIEGYARYCKDDKPVKPDVENHSSAQNVHLKSSIARRPVLPMTDVLQAINTLAQFYSCVSPNTGAEQVLNSFVQSLNINKPQPPSFQYANAPFALAPSPLSRYFGQESGSLLYQHNSASFPNTNSSNQPLPLHLNSMAIKDSCNSYSKIEAPKMPQLATEANYIKPTTNPSPSMSIMTEDDNDIFYDDDDDFNEVCAELGCVQKCVQRVELSFDYRIHIILLDNTPYVSAGDLTYLFWPNEASNLILRRLQRNCSYLPSKTVSEEDYSLMFQQLQSLKVKGLLKVHEKYTVTLILLEHVEQILNLFGHPSPTIRSEIRRELIQFDASSNIWKSFSEMISEDEKDAPIVYTDAEKFFRLCAYDLKATMEGLKYKRFTCEEKFKSDPTTKHELEEVYKQCDMYNRRIKEIESFSKLCQ